MKKLKQIIYKNNRKVFKAWMVLCLLFMTFARINTVNADTTTGVKACEYIDIEVFHDGNYSGSFYLRNDLATYGREEYNSNSEIVKVPINLAVDKLIEYGNTNYTYDGLYTGQEYNSKTETYTFSNKLTEGNKYNQVIKNETYNYIEYDLTGASVYTSNMPYSTEKFCDLYVVFNGNITLTDSNTTITPAGVSTTNGNALTPNLTVTVGGNTLTKNTDYTINSYSNNTGPGSASVTITGAGTYLGTITKTFNIYNVKFKNGNSILSNYIATSGGKVTAPASISKQGYDWVNWKSGNNTVNANAQATVTSSLTYEPNYSPRIDTQYKVEHYKQDTTLDGYTLAETQNLTGTTDTVANAVAKSYTGWTYNSNHVNNIKSGNIDPDGSRVLKLYYDIDKYTVTFKDFDGTILKTQENVPYSTSATAPELFTHNGYTFVEWSNAFDNVTGDVTTTAIYSYHINITKLELTTDENGFVIPEVATTETTVRTDDLVSSLDDTLTNSSAGTRIVRDLGTDGTKSYLNEERGQSLVTNGITHGSTIYIADNKTISDYLTDEIEHIDGIDKTKENRTLLTDEINRVKDIKQSFSIVLSNEEKTTLNSYSDEILNDLMSIATVQANIVKIKSTNNAVALDEVEVSDYSNLNDLYKNINKIIEDYYITPSDHERNITDEEKEELESIRNEVLEKIAKIAQDKYDEFLTSNDAYNIYDLKTTDTAKINNLSELKDSVSNIITMFNGDIETYLGDEGDNTKLNSKYKTLLNDINEKLTKVNNIKNDMDEVQGLIGKYDLESVNKNNLGTCTNPNDSATCTPNSLLYLNVKATEVLTNGIEPNDNLTAIQIAVLNAIKVKTEEMIARVNSLEETISDFNSRNDEISFDSVKVSNLSALQTLKTDIMNFKNEYFENLTTEEKVEFNTLKDVVQAKIDKATELKEFLEETSSKDERINTANVKASDQKELGALKTSIEAFLDENENNLTTEEKNALNQTIENLIEEIAVVSELNNTIDGIDHEVNLDQYNIDDVKTSDIEALNNTKESIESLLNPDNENYNLLSSIDIANLEELLNSTNDKLDRIDTVNNEVTELENGFEELTKQINSSNVNTTNKEEVEALFAKASEIVKNYNGNVDGNTLNNVIFEFATLSEMASIIDTIETTIDAVNTRGDILVSNTHTTTTEDEQELNKIIDKINGLTSNYETNLTENQLTNLNITMQALIEKQELVNNIKEAIANVETTKSNLNTPLTSTDIEDVENLISSINGENGVLNGTYKDNLTNTQKEELNSDITYYSNLLEQLREISSVLDNLDTEEYTDLKNTTNVEDLDKVKDAIEKIKTVLSENYASHLEEDEIITLTTAKEALTDTLNTLEGKIALNEAVTLVEEVNSENITIDDYDKIQELLDTMTGEQKVENADLVNELEELLNTEGLEEFKENLINKETEFNNLPLDTNVTSSDKATLEDLKEELETIISEDSSFLSDAAKENLNSKITEIEDKLAILEAVSEAKEQIEESLLKNIAVDEVKTEEADALKQYVNQIEKLIEDGNLTEEEIEELNNIKISATNALNEIERIINKIDRFDKNSDGFSYNTVTKDDKVDIKDQIDEIEKFIDEYYPEEGEKRISESEYNSIMEIKETLKEDLALINQVEEAVSIISETYDNLDHESNDYLDELRSLRETINNGIGGFGDNLTETQKTSLNNLLNDVNNEIKAELTGTDELDTANNYYEDVINRVEDIELDSVNENALSNLNSIKSDIQSILADNADYLTKAQKDELNENLILINVKIAMINEIETSINTVLDKNDIWQKSDITKENTDNAKNYLNKLLNEVNDLVSKYGKNEETGFNGNLTSSQEKELEQLIESINKKIEYAESIEGGKASIEDNSYENAGQAKISGNYTSNQLKNLINFDNEEENSIEQGAEVQISLVSQEANNTISAEEKALITNTAKTMENAKVDSYYDLNLFYKLSNSEDSKQVTKTNSKVSLSIDIPKNSLNYNSNVTRTFYMIAVSENNEGTNEASLIQATRNGNSLTFETNEFTTYALVYKDVVSGTTPTHTGSSSDDEDLISTLDIKLFSLYSGIRIEWFTIPGYNMYNVYRKEEGGKYTKLVTTSKLNYTDKTAKKGIVYYYKVKPYKVNSKNKKVYAYVLGPISGEKKVVSKTELELVKKTKSSIKVSYEKVSNASGYEIRYSTSKNGKYTLYTRTTNLSQTIKTLKTKKYYYIKVKAYKTVNGKRYYGYYSDKLKVKTK